MNHNLTNTRIAILRRFINGETYTSIAAAMGLRAHYTRNMSQDLQHALWQHIKTRDIPHPYTIQAYPDAWRGEGTRQFSCHYLTTWHLRREKLFWNRLLDQYQVEFGNVERKLSPDDPIERLNLPYRAMNALVAWKVKTIQQLLDMTKSPQGLTQVCNVGPATATQIMEVLEQNGFDVVIPKTMALSQVLRQAIIVLRAVSLYSVEQREELAQQMDRHLASMDKK